MTREQLKQDVMETNNLYKAIAESEKSSIHNVFCLSYTCHAETADLIARQDKYIDELESRLNDILTFQDAKEKGLWGAVPSKSNIK